MDLLELPGEVRLIGETQRVGHLGDRQTVPKQSLGRNTAEIAQVAHRGKTESASESADKRRLAHCFAPHDSKQVAAVTGAIEGHA